MSHEAVNWAYQQQVGNPITKFVLVTLADHADRHHRCRPSQKYLASRVEASERKVREALADLETAGLLARVARMRTRGRGRSSDEVVLAVAGPLDTIEEDSRSTGKRRRQVVADQPAADAGNIPPTNRHDLPEGAATNRQMTSDQPAAGAGPSPTGTEPSENPNPAAAQATARRDHVFEALCHVTRQHPDQLTKSARGRINAAARELVDVGLDRHHPDAAREITRRAGIYRALMPDVQLTATALAANWARCEHPPAAPGRPPPKDPRQAAIDLAAARARQGIDEETVTGELESRHPDHVKVALAAYRQQIQEHAA